MVLRNTNKDIEVFSAGETNNDIAVSMLTRGINFLVTQY